MMFTQTIVTRVLFWQAGGEGFEPPQANPESAVLPLDEPPVILRAVFYHACQIYPREKMLFGIKFSSSVAIFIPE
jgi:hypothetical protein